MTDVTQSADYAALLRGILEEPAADLPRLVLADFLEDHADEPHHHDYAEFVRVGCELAGMTVEKLGKAHRKLVDALAGSASPDVVLEVAFPGRRAADVVLGVAFPGRRELVARERELLAANEHLWSRPWRTKAAVLALRSAGVGCCDRSRNGDLLRCHCMGEAADFAWSRGFVGAVTLTLAQFVGGECGACGGSGRLMIHHRTHGDCPACSGTGRTPGLAAALFGAQPITAVTLSDRLPYWNGFGYCWYSSERVGERYVEMEGAELPGHLFARVDSATNAFGSPSPAAARDALSAALVAHGRELAGLPPLPTPADAVPA